MQIGIFSAKRYDQDSLTAANVEALAASARHELTFLEPRLTRETAALGARFSAVCVFVNDRVDAEVLATLAAGATRLVLLRCAGFNNVDVTAASRLGIAVARVPAYSPHAVAEHTVAMILGLKRKLARAINRVRDGNFALDGLLGTELHGRTVGIVGTGKIGATVAQVLSGFGVTLLAVDVAPNPDCLAAGVQYVALDELLRRADVITLHCPLTPETRHLLDTPRLSLVKPTAVVVNDDDGVVPTARQHDLAERISDAARFTVAGGHAGCTTAPGRFLPALLAACRHVCDSVAPLAPMASGLVAA